MSGPFSTVNLQIRAEIQDFLSRFCHAIDYNRTAEWAALFTHDAVVEAPRFGRFVGRQALSVIPSLVAEQGGGLWRQIFNNVVVTRNEGTRSFRVEAYCMVNDWGKTGAAVRCWDFAATIVQHRQFQMTHLRMQPVGRFCDNPRSYSEIDGIMPSEMVEGEPGAASPRFA